MENVTMATPNEYRETTRQNILAYAQSEKVKTGIIWTCQIADQVAVMEPSERRHGVNLLKTLAHMIADESDLAGRLTGDRRWYEIGKNINMALVMIDSGVPQETVFHLTQALTQVTRIGGQAAANLENEGLF